MSTVRCPNCAAQNVADLKFCTNCGNPLPAPNFSQPGASNASVQAPAKSTFGRNAAIIGGVGCVVLLLGAIALCGVLGYIGSSSSGNNNLANVFVGNANSSLANRDIIKSSNSNAIIFDDDNSSSSNNNNSSASNNRSSGPPTEEEFRNFLPAQIGEYEREGDASDGNVTEDYPGADKITKSDYTKKNKKVSVTVAQFASPATAKQSYGYFLDGFKGAGARILTKQKVKNKSGIETGDLAIYVYKKKWDTLVYADRFGFRITAPDKTTLADFLKAFGGYIELASSK